MFIKIEVLWNREFFLMVRCFMYLLGFNKKIEITKVFLNRGSLIEGIDYLDDIRVVKLMGNGEVI